MVKPVIVVIGASAGGVEALIRLVNDLPSDLPAVIGMVLHFPTSGTSVLPDILNRSGVLPAVHASNQLALQPGQICVAPPDRHLWIEDGHWRLTHGPRENGHRPAIDPLFRSAAQAYGSRVIGVILSGNLDDGTAGLQIIKHHGGLAVVQDPADALYPDMARSAIEHVAVDYVLPLDQMGAQLSLLVNRLTETSEGRVPPMTGEPNEEDRVVQHDKQALEQGARPGQPTVFTCPECGGTIWELDEGEALRFRCHVGHAYSAESFIAEQAERLESALWTAYRALEEKASLARRMAERARQHGNNLIEARFAEQALNASQNASLLRQALLNKDLTLPSAPKEVAEISEAHRPAHA